MKILKLRQNILLPKDTKTRNNDEFDEAIESIMRVRKSWESSKKEQRHELVETYFRSLKKLVELSRKQGCKSCIEKNLVCGFRSFSKLKHCRGENNSLRLISANCFHHFFKELKSFYQEEGKLYEHQMLLKEYKNNRQNLMAIN